MTDPLLSIFVIGLVWFGLAAVVVTAAATLYWVRTKRENPGHLVAWTSVVFTLFYLFQLLDWGFVLRNGDGVEFPWTRGATQTIAYFLYSWMVAVAMWLDWDDRCLVIGAHTVVGAALFAGDFTSGDKGWYWWALAVAVLVATLVFLLRRSRQNSFKAWAMWGGWLVYAVGVPTTQAFGWTLGKVINTPPERKDTEVMYLVAYTVGLTVYGAVMVWAYSKRPARTQTSTRDTPVLFPAGSSAVAKPTVTLSSTMSARTPYRMSTRE